MKSVLALALAAGLLAVTTSAMAEEADMGTIVAKCKSEASSEEIPAGELQQYLKQCLQDYGVPTDQLETAMKSVGAMPKKDED